MGEEENYLFATQLSTGSMLPMVLRTALELDLLELIKKASSSASASELAAQLPAKNPDAANMIDRILRLLTAHSVLNCSLKTLPDGRVERRYSLAPVCQFLTRNEDGVSVAPYCLMSQDRVLMESWYHLKDAILEGGIPFNRAYGMNGFEYVSKDQRFNKLFNQAMYEPSIIFMKKILEKYKGFEGLKSLFDVGGGIGASLEKIISKYPSIKGINFDLPHVIQNAPSSPGMDGAVSGDMFVSVPKADAILLKWVCHDWSDSHCKKLLKNCYEALPQNGKVILVEYIVPEIPDTSLSSKTVCDLDMVMLAHLPGKERTEKEFQPLAKEAGFKEFNKVCGIYNFWIIELYK